MSYQSKKDAYKRLKSLIQTHYPDGCSKTQGYPGETKEHYRVKSDIVHWLKSNGYSVYTEATLTGHKGRPDVIGIHPGGMAVIIEVLHSETEKKSMSKDLKYPEEFFLIKVKTEDWNYDTFSI